MNWKAIALVCITATTLVGGAYARSHPYWTDPNIGSTWLQSDNLGALSSVARSTSPFDTQEWQKPVLAPWATHLWQTLAASKYSWKAEIARPFPVQAECKQEAKQAQKPIIRGVSDEVTVVLLGLLFGAVMALMSWIILKTRIGLV